MKNYLSVAAGIAVVFLGMSGVTARAAVAVSPSEVKVDTSKSYFTKVICKNKRSGKKNKKNMQYAISYQSYGNFRVQSIKYSKKTKKYTYDVTRYDEDKKQKLTVTMPSGTVLEIDDEKQLVTTKNKGGDTSLVMNMKDGEIELKAKSKLTLSAGNASIVLEQNGNVTITGNGGDVSVEGKGVKVKSQGSLGLEGVSTDVKASMDLNLSATKTASVKGAILKLN